VRVAWPEGRHLRVPVIYHCYSRRSFFGKFFRDISSTMPDLSKGSKAEPSIKATNSSNMNLGSARRTNSESARMIVLPLEIRYIVGRLRGRSR
jgi:hypothetical protein